VSLLATGILAWYSSLYFKKGSGALGGVCVGTDKVFCFFQKNGLRKINVRARAIELI
jgi:hypothetical protein